MKKQLLSIILALLPMLAIADDSGSCGTYVTYTFVSSTGTLTIQGSGRMKDYSTYSSVPWDSYRTNIKTVIIEEGVTSIGSYAFTNCSGLTSVTIGNSVTSIGESAFEDCSGITSVEIHCPQIGSWFSDKNSIKEVIIGNEVTSIGESAFQYCSGLTSVTIGNSVTNIGDYAFCYCSVLTSVTIPNSVTSIGYEAFFGCTGLQKVIVPDIAAWCGISFADNSANPLYYANHIYSDENKKIKELVIPDGVTSIGNYAFGSCKGLTSVTIPNSVTSIGSDAFSGCSGLTSVTIGNSVTSIGYYAFYGCSGLTSVIIPNSVTSIGEWAFRDCSGLTSVIIGNSVTSIGDYAFNGCFGLSSVEFHCAQIGSWFKGMTSIKEVVIGNEVTSIGSDAFQNCSGLTSVTIPNSVTSIGDYAFTNCSGLQKVIVPDIAAWCGISFAGFYSNPLNYAHHIYSDEDTEITDLVIPNSVTSIGSGAFRNCSSLTSVTLPNSVTSIGDYAFYGCSGLQKVIVSDIAAWCGIKFFPGSNPLYYAHHIYSDENTEIKDLVIPNTVTNIESYAFKGCSGLTSVTIPNSVTSIGSDAFWGCSGLTSITIPNSVTSIGDYAFEGCSSLSSVEFHCPQIGSWFKGMTSIKEVVIGNEVTSIGSGAFQNCSGLTSVTIPNSVTSIGSYAFRYCSSLTSVEFHCAQIGSWFSNMTSIEEITIGNEVTSIGDYAFKGCSGLTSVAIPNSVRSIGSGAFSGCTGLQKVIVPDIAAWCGISFGNNPLEYTHHIYSDENTEIKDLVIPDGVTSIGSDAFNGCSGLTSITIPNSVTSIGSGAFSGCTGLQKVIVPDIAAWCGIRFANEVSNPLFYAHHLYSDENTEIKELVIPDGVTSIGGMTFRRCLGLTSVTIPNSVTSIGSHAFFYCSDLTSVTIGNGVTSIESSAFRGCSGLTSVTIPNSVTSIGSYAFEGCSGLTSVTIGSGIMKIDYYAFSCSPKLSTINVLMDIPVEINEQAFKYTGENYSSDIIYLAATLNVPIGSKALYSNVKGWKKFMNINEVDFTPKHKLVYVVDGVEYKVYEIAEGAEITPEPAPTKEGYTFSGWSEIPETMPAHDVTVTGTFSINKYKLTYKVDGVEYKSSELEYGAEITPEPTPTKEGYTFSGWSEIPETMPAYDVTVTGSFAVNQYLITYMIGDEVYQKEYVDYGATIVLPNVPEREGYSFAWIDAPEKMPAHDITINGAYTSGMWGISNDDATTNTYTISGYKTDKPRRGVNIIRMSDGTTRKVVVK